MALGSLLEKKERRSQRGAAGCQKRVGTVPPLRKTWGRSLGLLLKQMAREPLGWVEGNVPKSGGNSSLSSSWAQGQGELGEQLPWLPLPLALCFHLPSAPRPLTYPCFHFRNQGRDRKKKKKRLVEARASLASTKSNQRRRSWETLAPPLKEPSAAALRVLEWEPRGLQLWKRSQWALQQCLRTGVRFLGFLWLDSYTLPRPGDRGQPPSHSLFPLHTKPGSVEGPPPRSLPCWLKTEALLYHAEVEREEDALGWPPPWFPNAAPPFPATVGLPSS